MEHQEKAELVGREPTHDGTIIASYLRPLAGKGCLLGRETAGEGGLEEVVQLGGVARGVTCKVLFLKNIYFFVL